MAQTVQSVQWKLRSKEGIQSRKKKVSIRVEFVCLYGTTGHVLNLTGPSYRRHSILVSTVSYDPHTVIGFNYMECMEYTFLKSLCDINVK